jgi:hypothetical protein
MYRPVLPAFIGLMLLHGCASAPKDVAVGISTQQPMAIIRDESYARAERYLDADAVLRVRSLAVPRIRLAEGAVDEDITAEQAELVANRVSREVCLRLAPYLHVDDEAPDLDIELIVTAIRATSPLASGISAGLGVFVPGPFRLPAGLGGFAADGVARYRGQELLVLRWAEGANAVTDSAKVSTIGDAYQLAAQFAADFSDHLIGPKDSAAARRPRLSDTVIQGNNARCHARFGKASLAGRGASLLLPLAPEAIDEGAPRPAADDGVGDDQGTDGQNPGSPQQD